MLAPPLLFPPRHVAVSEPPPCRHARSTQFLPGSDPCLWQGERRAQAHPEAINVKEGQARKPNLLREYRPRPQGTSSTITAMAQKQTPATYRMLRFFGAVIVVARIVGIVSAVLGLVLQDGYASASVQIIIFGLILIVAGVGLYRWCQRRVGNS